MEPLPMIERAVHARELIAHEVNAWVASATADGQAYMIPLTYEWDGNSMLFSTPANSRTVRDLRRAGRTRVALPSATDVVVMDGTVEILDENAVRDWIEAFVVHHGWDPRKEPNAYAFFKFTPDAIQAWRIASELPTRTVMRNGRWLDLDQDA